MTNQIISRGAEAVLIKQGSSLIKKRVKKSYRIPEIDEKLRKLRTRSEARLLEKASSVVFVPKIIKADEKDKVIEMQFIEGKKLSENLDNFSLEKQKQICFKIGEEVSKLHELGVIHSDLTTSNMILKEDFNKNNTPANTNNLPSKASQDLNIINNDNLTRSKRGAYAEAISNEQSSNPPFKVYFIDFGLSFSSSKIEDKAVDLHLLRQALESKHFKHWHILFQEVLKGYEQVSEAEKVLKQLEKVEKRGRYKGH